jgi:hypothetical protein
MSERSNRDGETHTVRPRWTWIALVVLLAGAVLLGIGDVQNTKMVIALGLVVLVAGGGTALYGGFFYDVQGGASPRAQLRDVVEGNEREFPGAGTMRSEPEVEDDIHRRWLSEGERRDS